MSSKTYLLSQESHLVQTGKLTSFLDTFPSQQAGTFKTNIQHSLVLLKA